MESWKGQLTNTLPDFEKLTDLYRGLCHCLGHDLCHCRVYLRLSKNLCNNRNDRHDDDSAELSKLDAAVEELAIYRGSSHNPISRHYRHSIPESKRRRVAVL